MPKLRKDEAAGVVHRPGDLSPSFDLFGGVDPGRIRPADRLLADLRAFRDDQAGCGALGVIARGQFVRHTIGRPASRHGSHEDAIFKFERVGFQRGQQFQLGHLTLQLAWMSRYIL